MQYYDDYDHLYESGEKFGFDKQGNFKPHAFLELGPSTGDGTRKIYSEKVKYPGVQKDYLEYEKLKLKIQSFGTGWRPYAIYKYGDKLERVQDKVFNSGDTEEEGYELEKKWKEDLAKESKEEVKKLEQELRKIENKMSDSATKYKEEYRAKAQANKDAKVAAKDASKNAKAAKRASDIEKLESGLENLRKLEKDLVGLSDPKTQKKREMLKKKKDAINKKLDALKSIKENLLEGIILDFNTFQEVSESVDALLDFSDLY